MKKRRNKLSEMTIKSVDVCGRGANQEADIVLKKSMEDGERMSIYDKITDAISGLVGETAKRKLGVFAKAMQESEESIMSDASMDDQAKIEMLDKSIDQYFDAVHKAIDEDDPDDQDEGSDDEDKTNEKSDVNKEKGEKKMDFEVEKMSAEDRATYEGLKKKYGGIEKSADIHPEVKKAMDEVAEMRKAMEMRDLEDVAKAYEICGKNPKELAGKLYDLKKAGGSAYDD